MPFKPITLATRKPEEVTKILEDKGITADTMIAVMAFTADRTLVTNGSQNLNLRHRFAVALLVDKETADDGKYAEFDPAIVQRLDDMWSDIVVSVFKLDSNDLVEMDVGEALMNAAQQILGDRAKEIFQNMKGDAKH